MVAEAEAFHPVIHMPEEYWVFDFTRGEDKTWVCPYDYQIGRYDEYRPGMYTTELFGGVRDVHVGLDIGAPVATPVYAFFDGVIHSFGNNSEDGSYGPTIVTEHYVSLPEEVGSQNFGSKTKVWALHGHLSLDSLKDLEIGSQIKAGEMIAKIGSEEVNGGWPPHLHFQLSLIEPDTYDMPGVVEQSERDWALQVYLDPRLVLGKLY
jgi:murein DD-endopeptidase MepM/ murein hydrolase activator NlpD